MTYFLAVLTGGGLSAAGGFLTAWVTNRQGAKRDERRYTHERTLAREARGQDRLEKAYQRLGEYLSYYRQWSTSVRPLWGPIPAPDPPSNEDLREIETLVGNYGSPEVRQLVDELSGIVAKIRNADDLIRLVDQSANPSDELDEEAGRERLAMIDYKENLHQLSGAIRDQMNQELAGTTPAIESNPGQRGGQAIEGR